MKSIGIKSDDSPQRKSPDSHIPPTPSAGSRSLRTGLLLALAIIVADQSTKTFMLFTIMSPPRVISVTPFFNLRLGLNTGISFGLFGSDSQITPWVLSAIAIAIVIGLIGLLYRSQHMEETIGLGAAIGGALGNVIDRVRQGAVTDFLDFHVGDWHWPTFNLADAAIATGVGLLVVSSIFFRIPSARLKDSS